MVDDPGNIIISTVPPSPPVRVGNAAETAAAQRTAQPATPTSTLLPSPTTAPTLTPDLGLNCPNAPPSRLALNQTVRVQVLEGISLRRLPGAQADRIASLPYNTTLTVIGGPQCDGTFLWWQVRAEGFPEGWVAEGEPGTYYLDPVLAEN